MDGCAEQYLPSRIRSFGRAGGWHGQNAPLLFLVVSAVARCMIAFHFVTCLLRSRLVERPPDLTLCTLADERTNVYREQNASTARWRWKVHEAAKETNRSLTRRWCTLQLVDVINVLKEINDRSTFAQERKWMLHKYKGSFSLCIIHVYSCISIITSLLSYSVNYNLISYS